METLYKYSFKNINYIMAEEENQQLTNNTTSSTESTTDKGIQAMPDTPNSAEIKNLTNINFEDIALVEKVGHGSYGVVYKALLNNRYVAVKEFGPAADQKVIETEIKQLSRVSHENIIALYGKASYQNFEYLIMEYAEGGSLHNFLHGQVKPYYSTAHAISWARQCAEGVAYLHAMQPKPMIHRDLKPLNLLLTDKGRNLKICDFGTVADKSTLMTNNRGSAAWMAPEVFEGNNYTEKCDIFSWSIVLWEVLSRQIPFKEIDNTYSIMWKIHKGVRPPLIKDCPQPIQNLMVSCWATKPDDRPSMNHVAAAMRTLALVFPGAEEPLDYEYVNQQILNNSDDSLENNISSLDFGDFQTVWRDTCNSLSSQTDRNPLGMALIAPQLTEILQIPKPQTSVRYGVIPEESESSCFNTENNNTADYEQPLKSTESNKRNETIRNEMYEKADMPMSPLHVNVGNCWDAVDNEQGKYSVNNNYRESLMLSEDDSLTQLLDADLQPVLPIPGNAQSEDIYRQHQQLGNEHLRVVTELVYAQDFKEKILLQMEPAERRQKEELLRKMGEKEELLELYNNLKQQLEKLRSESKDMQQTYGTPEQCLQPADAMNEEGWVVLSSPQNT